MQYKTLKNYANILDQKVKSEVRLESGKGVAFQMQIMRVLILN